MRINLTNFCLRAYAFTLNEITINISLSCFFLWKNTYNFLSAKFYNCLNTKSTKNYCIYGPIWLRSYIFFSVPRQRRPGYFCTPLLDIEKNGRDRWIDKLTRQSDPIRFLSFYIKNPKHMLKKYLILLLNLNIHP